MIYPGGSPRFFRLAEKLIFTIGIIGHRREASYIQHALLLFREFLAKLMDSIDIPVLGVVPSSESHRSVICFLPCALFSI